MHFFVAKQGFMGIRPNKTNFGLSFGDFWGANVKRIREEEEEERKKGTELRFCLDS